MSLYRFCVSAGTGKIPNVCDVKYIKDAVKDSIRSCWSANAAVDVRYTMRLKRLAIF